MGEKLAFGFEINKHTDDREIILFLDSLKKYGGKFSEYPVYILKQSRTKQPSEKTLNKIQESDAELIQYDIEEEEMRFYFADKVTAAAHLEGLLENEVDILSYLSQDTLFLNEPEQLLLDKNISLGYRPVHHKLIGSAYDEPLDGFWSLNYKVCGVGGEDIFPMNTCVDEKVRPYFNAGFLNVRPEKRILRTWKDNFFTHYQTKEFKKFYEEPLYKVFVHQTILSATIISILDKEEIYELPQTYNYPLNLLKDIPEEERPESIHELVTARYDQFKEFFVEKKDYELIDMDDDFRDWLLSKVS